MKKLILVVLFPLLLFTACGKKQPETANAPVPPAVNGDSVEDHTEKITDEIKEYILHGQMDKPGAEQVKWSETFLNYTDIPTVYQEYLDQGGTPDHMERFAKYLTANAPIPDNWQTLVKSDVFMIYGRKAVRFEHLEKDLYEVFVEIDGSEVAYLVVSSRTGWIHG